MLKFVRPYCTGVSATFAHRNHHLASEILTNFRGQNVASHWIEASYVVISAALAYHKHAGTIEAKRLRDSSDELWHIRRDDMFTCRHVLFWTRCPIVPPLYASSPHNQTPNMGCRMSDQHHHENRRSCTTCSTLLARCTLARPHRLDLHIIRHAFNMSCLPESQDCNGCPSSTDNCQSAPVGGSVDIEDYTTELAALKARMRTLESKLSGKISEDTKVLRSWQWLNRSDDPGMSALYLDRYLNYGLTEEELSSHKPIIGIAQSGSDLAPCNRHHLTLAKRVREGIRSAGGIAIEFPTHPIQETSRRPTATLDRNLSYLGLVELLHAYPFDGVVLLTGCDKTTPACTF